MITELLPETVRGPAFWGELELDRREQAWKVMEKVNDPRARDIVRICGRAEGDCLEAQGGAPVTALDHAMG